MIAYIHLKNVFIWMTAIKMKKVKCYNTSIFMEYGVGILFDLSMITFKNS